MISFECSFEVRTRQDAVWALQEIISQIEGITIAVFSLMQMAHGQAVAKKNQKKISKKLPERVGIDRTIL